MSGVAASSLAVLARVASGREPAVLPAIRALKEGHASPFARVPGTHFGRFAYLPALPGPGGVRLTEHGAFLLMCADFDQPLTDWSAALCSAAGAEFDSVLGHCEGYPGSADPAAVAEFFAAHDVPAGFTVAGYRRSTVEQVRDALRLRRQLRELATRTQYRDLAPSAVRAAWDEVLGA